MPGTSDRKSLIIAIFVFSLVVFGTLTVSFIARGYRLNFQNGISLKSTGLLSVTSNPRSASVYINDRLITATDDTVNLPPGNYFIKIAKDGYLPWQKDVQIKKEVVFLTDAQLFRSAPDLKPITTNQAINPTVSPDFTRLVYAVASASAAKDNGLYLLDLTAIQLPIGRNLPKLIAPNYPYIDWSKFTFEFSPNSTQILATNKLVTYLLPIDSPITAKNLFDITPRLSLIKEDWQKQLEEIMTVKIDRLPKTLQPLVSTQSARNIALNSADDKVLYMAKVDSQLPGIFITPPPAQSTQTQTRDLKKNNYYIYDIKDDTNFLIGPASNLINLSWLPYSNSLIYTQDQKVFSLEYDNTNHQTIFGGSFDPNLVFPWSDGNRIVTLISPYVGASSNLYSVTIR